MKANEITPEQLAAEFAATNATCEAKGLTTRELCAIWKCGIEAGRRKLRRAHELGVLRRGQKVLESYNGSPNRVTTYWFERTKKKK